MNNPFIASFFYVRRIISNYRNIVDRIFRCKPWSIRKLYHFIQPLIPLNAPTEPKEPQEKVLSPVSRKTEGLQQRSQNVPSQADHSSSTEDEATESEVESLKFEKGMKLKKKGMWYIIFFPSCQVSSWIMYYSFVVINFRQVRIIYIKQITGGE